MSFHESTTALFIAFLTFVAVLESLAGDVLMAICLGLILACTGWFFLMEDQADG